MKEQVTPIQTNKPRMCRTANPQICPEASSTEMKFLLNSHSTIDQLSKANFHPWKLPRQAGHIQSSPRHIPVPLPGQQCRKSLWTVHWGFHPEPGSSPQQFAVCELCVHGGASPSPPLLLFPCLPTRTRPPRLGM